MSGRSVEAAGDQESPVRTEGQRGGGPHSPLPHQADLVVLNTCTVTEAADSDVRQTVRRVHRENAAARDCPSP